MAGNDGERAVTQAVADPAGVQLVEALAQGEPDVDGDVADVGRVAKPGSGADS